VDNINLFTLNSKQTQQMLTTLFKNQRKNALLSTRTLMATTSQQFSS